MITWVETSESGASTQNPPAVTKNYRLAGVFEESTARGYALQATANIYAGLYRQDVKVDPDGFNIWKITVPYGVLPVTGGQGGGDSWFMEWGWDTTGATAKITQAIEHVNSYRVGATGGNPHMGAIGVHDGEVEGVEVVIPAFKWWEKYRMPRSYATMGYSIICEGLTGCANTTWFRGRVRNTVRFDGAQAGGTIKELDKVELTFHFTASPRVWGVTVGAITGVVKGGWDYGWIEYQSEQDAAAKKNVKQPIAVHVEQVMQYGDFSLLGIGTGLL